MNVVLPKEVRRPLVDGTKLNDKLSVTRIVENCKTNIYVSRTSPSGETYDGDISDHNESYPTHVSPNSISGPYISEELDSFDGDASSSESVATSLICGDNLEKRIIQRSPRLSEDSLTLPVSGESFGKLNKLDFHSNFPNRCEKVSVTSVDDETFIISSSTSLLTEDYEKIPEPMKARVQLHRRKRLEWKFNSSNPSTVEHKCPETSNSWTVYDDLLEEIEENLDASGRRCDPQQMADSDPPCNGTYQAYNDGISTAIENYLNQRFLNFPEESKAGFCYQYLPLSPTKMCAEMSTMTDPEEQEEDDSACRRKAHCLPLCRCMPKK
ncbi:hypothetical protein FBUS_08032 [Fasciolopsis buskii]|uniref:Uncharacterized protein n=1 Tax=Fasciolopsis buskii TaxID=27845 RepID=A0A8E0RM07_9TREM|nr:hypothetical protein FBUS_08032 [Fasciolopsis buski]